MYKKTTTQPQNDKPQRFISFIVLVFRFDCDCNVENSSSCFALVVEFGFLNGSHCLVIELKRNWNVFVFLRKFFSCNIRLSSGFLLPFSLHSLCLSSCRLQLIELENYRFNTVINFIKFFASFLCLLWFLTIFFLSFWLISIVPMKKCFNMFVYGNLYQPELIWYMKSLKSNLHFEFWTQDVQKKIRKLSVVHTKFEVDYYKAWVNAAWSEMEI